MTGYKSKRAAAQDKLEQWDNEALKLALEALENGKRVRDGEGGTKYQPWLEDAAITAIKEALAQPAQEPVAWMWRCKPYYDYPNWEVSLKRPADSGRNGNKKTDGYEDVPLYAAPPQPEQEPAAWPCVIAEANFEQNTITLEMQCSNYKVGAGQHWLYTTPPQKTI